MRSVVLVCAVTLLLYPPNSCDGHETINRRNLNLVFDLAEQCTASLCKQQMIFVEDVSQGRNKCGDTFFCKVQEILGSLHVKHCSVKLVAQLRMYNRYRNVNCTEAVEGVKRVHGEITVATLMNNLMLCIRQRNFKGTK